MKICAVAVGMPGHVQHAGKEIVTGIFKSPVSGPVTAGLLNLEGDGQADLSVHGGRDKALYAYPFEHYEYWKRELGIDVLEPSQFGENLTITGMNEASVVLGDRYRMGNVITTVTQPRLPCFKLGIRMANAEFPNRLLHSGRLGFYLRVEQEGTLKKGDSIELLWRPDHGISAFDLWHTVFVAKRDADVARKTLDALPHIDTGWIRRLKRLTGDAGRLE